MGLFRCPKCYAICKTEDEVCRNCGCVLKTPKKNDDDEISELLDNALDEIDKELKTPTLSEIPSKYKSTKDVDRFATVYSVDNYLKKYKKMIIFSAIFLILFAFSGVMILINYGVKNEFLSKISIFLLAVCPGLLILLITGIVRLIKLDVNLRTALIEEEMRNDQKGDSTGEIIAEAIDVICDIVTD